MISVLMPVYNCELYISEAINSILSQTYSNFELIIINDGSTDNSEKIIKSFSDSRIKYFRTEHCGIPSALNFGLSKAKGKLIARMDGDDIAVTDKLQKQYNFLKKNNNIHLVGSNFNYIDKFGLKLFYKKYPERHEDIEFSMPVIISVLHSTILTYKDILLKVGKYNVSYSNTEDLDIFLRIIKSGYKMYNIQEPLYRYRIWINNSKKFDNQIENSYKFGKNYLDNFYSEKNDKEFRFDKNWRFGLLEYYKGSISKSRKYFLECILISPLRLFKVVRYFFPSLLGDRIMSLLREKGLLSNINKFFNKILKIDTYKIRL
ncbi:glycosyltransferase family 2 protein [Bacteroidota bacterium]